MRRITLNNALGRSDVTASRACVALRRNVRRRYTRAVPVVLAMALGPAGSALAAEVPDQGGQEQAAYVYLPLTSARVDLDGLPRAPVVSATATPTEPTVQAATASPSPDPTASPTPLPTATPYTETLTDLDPIRDLRGRYDERRWYETLLELLARRYATGHAIVAELDDSEREAARWVGDDNTASFEDLLSRVELTVHEMNHQLGLQEGLLQSGWSEYAYVVRDDLRLRVHHHPTFPRSEIAKYVTGRLANRYKRVYLESEHAEQGFFTLLDEFNAYTHSLFVGYGLHDELRGHSLSYRDGIVTMMMYVEFYLRHARLEHPDVYDRLRADPDVRELVTILWARAMFILDVTEDLRQLRLDPDDVEAAMRSEDMLAEVEQFVSP